MRAAREIAPAELERRHVLQKEHAGLWREQREARGVDLPHVQRRIGEIGIHRQCVGERRRDFVEGVAARSEADAGAVAGQLPVVFEADHAIDLNVEPETLADILNSCQIAGLADVGEFQRRRPAPPIDAFVLVADAAPGIETPNGLRGIVGEARKRDGELHGITVGDSLCARGPDRVPFLELLRVVELELVGPPSRGAHLEIVGVAPGLARVDVEGDGIGGRQPPIALHRARNDVFRMAVIGIEAEIEIVLIVEDAQDRSLGRGLARVGALLRELVDHAGFGPDRVRKVAVYRGRFRRVDADRLDARSDQSRGSRRRRLSGREAAQHSTHQQSGRRSGAPAPENPLHVSPRAVCPPDVSLACYSGG